MKNKRVLDIGTTFYSSIVFGGFVLGSNTSRGVSDVIDNFPKNENLNEQSFLQRYLPKSLANEISPIVNKVKDKAGKVEQTLSENFSKGKMLSFLEDRVSKFVKPKSEKTDVSDVKATHSGPTFNPTNNNLSKYMEPDPKPGFFKKLMSFNPLISRQKQQNELELQRKRQFLHDFLGQPEIGKGALIEQGNKLGQGAFGVVHEGSLGNQQIILKKGIADKGREDMQRELTNSNVVMNAFAEGLGQQNPNYGELLGMGAIVPVIGTTSEGDLVQMRVQGDTLLKAVTQLEVPPYSVSHFPDNPQEAIRRLAGYFYALIALHSKNLIHCDIKPDNIMLSKDLDEYSLLLIDFGLARKSGEILNACSPNGGPEIVRIMNQLSQIRGKINEFRDQLSVVTFDLQKLQNPFVTFEDNQREFVKNFQKTGSIKEMNQQIQRLQNKIYDNFGKMEEKTISRIKKLEWKQQFCEYMINSLSNLAESIDLPIVQPSYDIYSSASILLPALFGGKGMEVAEYLYFDGKYLMDAQVPNFNAKNYFQQIFTELNQDMQRSTGQSFPQIVLTELANLEERMSAIDPEERPSAIEITESLQSMGLANWEKGEYFLNINW